MNKKTRYGILLGIVVVLVGLFVWYRATPGPYDALATCLTDQNVKFYGAFWCKNCERQKQMFSKSMRLVNYIECSTPDGKGQLPVCDEAGVDRYPTWEFADGNRVTGVMELADLAEQTSCPLK